MTRAASPGIGDPSAASSASAFSSGDGYCKTDG
eukprot:CAMPEP_0185785404 /NCGR_PEP_ID=MMETSP1174-20130828/129450_1 /TAXON_ID=35687 /ORGANISM="Dictyocha speculum, Strain CCMP1381" /LENGTH=32 /DNA_ID= /DNA_START= /DNA_END= /DNA_ORIENTATION=